MLKLEDYTPAKNTFTLRTTDAVTIKVPGTNHKTTICYVPVTELPEQLLGFISVNPRHPVLNKQGWVASGQGPKIRRTLEDAPSKIQLKNRGIKLLVKSCTVQQNAGGQKSVQISLTDPDLHGIVDGLHTFTTCVRASKDPEFNHDELKQAKVKIEIDSGTDESEIVDIADGLNSSWQVDPSSLENLTGQYEPIKQALKDHYSLPRISFHQGDTGPVHISDVITLLILIDKEYYGGTIKTRIPHPHKIYRHKGKSRGIFHERMENSPTFRNTINRLPELIDLWDNIQYHFQDNYNIGGRRYGRITHAKKAGPSYGLPFSGRRVEYKVPDGWVIPIYSAFRANVTYIDNKFCWIKPIQTIYDEVISELTITSVQHDEPTEAGRSETLFGSLYNIVKAEVK